MNASVDKEYLLNGRDEHSLIRACVAGDRDARTELFHRYRDMIHRFAYRFVGPVADMDDIIHDIYIELFKSLKRFRGESRLSTWLYSIAANVCFTYLKKTRRRGRVFVPYEVIEGQEAHRDNATDGDRVFARRYVRGRIGEALLKLNEKKRLVLILHDIEGRTMEEIARVVKKPVGTVKSRLFHARSEMRGILKDLMSEPML
ncbi:MAG: sigma-70 family RNA polymerase sigma factor [Chitinivibrionales bacterium]|nr:sigma-70 family RNA polymerase sigma factor [Chitinivibrionales bacterium]MBD3358702.1 sigma-70 family RNA polymerase sigma factor [Chitinivibrionales bacterium]